MISTIAEAGQPQQEEEEEGARGGLGGCLDWVAVKELSLSYYIAETLLFTIYTHCCNFI